MSAGADPLAALRGTYGSTAPATPQDYKDSGMQGQVDPLASLRGTFTTQPATPRAPGASEGDPLAYFRSTPPTPEGPPVGIRPSVVPPSAKPGDGSGNWLSKSWDWLNSPLIDADSIKKVTGWDPRGITENVSNPVLRGLLTGGGELLSGLSSPLSLAFIIGSMGVGGLVESAGSTVLSRAGLSAAEIADVGKGSQILTQTLRTGRGEAAAAAAMTAEGIDASKVMAGLKKLDAAGLKPETLLNRGLMHDTASALLRKTPGLSIAQADKVATGIRSLVDAGFAYNNIVGAALSSKRTWDALKEGDYEDAARFAVDAVGGGGFGALGAYSGVKTLGHFMPEIKAALGLRNAPWQENAAVVNEFGKHMEATASSQREQFLKMEELRKKYPDLKEDDLHLVFKWVQSGLSETEMAKRFNALAESAGRDTRIPVPDEPGGVSARIMARHGSPIENIELLDPNFQGTNAEVARGKERARIEAYPEIAPPRVYLQKDGTLFEPFYKHLPNQYAADFETEKLYPIDEDPHGLYEKAQRLAKEQRDPSIDRVVSLYEREIKNAGYDGYITPQGTIAAFTEVPVRPYAGAQEATRLAGRGLVTRPGEPLTPKGSPELVSAAEDYIRDQKTQPVNGRELLDTDPRAQEIGRAYESLEHNPNDPKVKASYDALKSDIQKQWDYATQKLGIKFEPTQTDPYHNSAQMMEDVRNNKNLRFFTGGDMPADHPLAEVNPKTGLTYNDMFRAVHDLFGHATEGFEFGPKGEENAWNAHRRMFSPAAIPALTTETKGQNSWVNFGPHIDTTNPPPAAERPFAEQKAGLLPEEYWKRPEDLEPTGVAGRRPSKAVVASHLTENERQQLSAGREKTAKARWEKFKQNVSEIPAVKDYVAAAKAGEVNRFWYERSIHAFNAMRELAPDYFHHSDADRWSGVLAATSPQQGVPLNLREALDFWKGWVDAGRPMTEKEILAAQEAGQIPHLTNQDSKLPNVIKALNGEEMLPADRDKYYKVGSFAGNLRGIGRAIKNALLGRKEINPVTNDSWMGIFGGVPEEKVPTPEFYHAMSLNTRLAAQELNWEPEQAQAAVWSFTKTLAELSGWKAAGGKYYSPVVMLAHMTPENMSTYAKDFADIMYGDHEIQARLIQMGVDINELKRRLEQAPAKPTVTPADARLTSASLRRSAERIAAAQQKLKGFTNYSKFEPETRFDFGANEPAGVAARTLVGMNADQIRAELSDKPEFAEAVINAKTGLDREVAKMATRLVAPTTARPGYIHLDPTAANILLDPHEGAVTISPGHTDNLVVNKLTALKNDPFTSEASKAAIDRTLDQVKQLRGAGQPVVLIGDEKYIPHELTHAQQYGLGNGLLTQHGDVAAAYGHDLTQKAVAGLENSSGYQNMGRTEAVAEIAAHILTGDGHKTGLSEAEQASWLGNYFDGIEKKHGAEGVLKLLSEATDQFQSQKAEYTRKLAESEPARVAGRGEELAPYERPVEGGKLLNPERQGINTPEGQKKYIRDQVHNFSRGKSRDEVDKATEAAWAAYQKLPQIPDTLENVTKRVGQLNQVVNNEVAKRNWNLFIKPGSKAFLADENTAHPVIPGEPGSVAGREEGLTPGGGNADRQQRVADWLGRLLNDRARSDMVKGRMDDLEESEADPRPILKEFWDKTFPALDERGQKAYLHNFERQMGVKPGDTLVVNKDGSHVVAKSWRDITDVWLKDSAKFDGLEQNEQAVTALADMLNEQRIKGERQALPQSGLPAPTPIQGEPGSVAAREPRRFRETDDDRIRELIAEHHLRDKDPKYLDKLLNSYDYRRLGPDHRALAKEISDWNTLNYDRANTAGVLGDDQHVKNYLAQIWKKNIGSDQADNRLLHTARTSGEFSLSSQMAMHRTFANSFEGELLGKELAKTDPIALSAWNGSNLMDVANTRALFDRLMDLNVRASDGRPMLAPAGGAHVVTGDDGENPAAFVNPKTVRSIRISQHIVDGLQQTGDLQKLVDEEKIKKLGKDNEGHQIYGWNPADYANLDHPGLRKWNFTAATPDGTNILLKSDLLVHPEFRDYLSKRLGVEQSRIQKTAIGRAALAASREAKGFLLFGSPFHMTQEGLRAIMTGVSPVGIDHWSLHNAEWTRGADGELKPANNDAVLSLGVRNNLTLGADMHSVESFEESSMAGHSKILSKVPFAGRYQNWMNDFLFKKYIPSLKARAFTKLFNDYTETYAKEGWTQDKIAQKAAEDVNRRFGGINYKAMGRSMATQDWLRLGLLAPDWLESEMGFMGSMFGEGGKIPRRDVIRMAAGLWAAARVLNYVVSGKGHYEAPFGVAWKDKEGKESVYSLRTLPTDLLHAASDPSGFMAGRIAPLVKGGSEALLGVDERGHKLPPSGLMVNMLRQVAPIPLQTAVKTATGETPDLSTPDQIVKAAGLTVAPYRTEAEKLAGQIASSHSEQGEIDPVKLRQHQAILEFENRIRSGQMGVPDLNQMVQSGALAPKQAKEIMQNVQQTHGMAPDQARLWSQASRAPFPDFIKVWNMSTPEEHAVLAKLLLRKKAAYLKKAATDFSPEERRNDPSLRWIARTFPGTPMF